MASKKKWLLPLGYLISLICLYFAFRKLDWQSFEETFFSITPIALLGGLALAQIHNFVGAWKWQWLLKGVGRISYWTAFWNLRLAFFFNASLPARMGEPFRIYYIKRFSEISAAKAIGAYAADRFLDLLGLLSFVYISAVVLGMKGSLPDMSFILLGAAAVFALLFFVAKIPNKTDHVWLKKVFEFRSRLLEGLKSLVHFKIMWLAVPLTLFNWMVEAWTVMVLAHGISVELSLFQSFMMVGAVNLAISVPSSPGHIGTFQVAAIAVLVFFGIDKEAAASIAILYHAVQLLPTIIIGAYGYHFHFLKKKPMPPPPFDNPEEEQQVRDRFLEKSSENPEATPPNMNLDSSNPYYHEAPKSYQ